MAYLDLIFKPRLFVKWDPGANGLPLVGRQKPRPVAGFIFAMLGLAAAIGITAFVAIELLSPPPKTIAAVVFLLIFGLFFLTLGGFFTFTGLHLVVNKTCFTISAVTVTKETRDLKGSSRWQEPLQNYQGIFKSFAHYASGSGVSDGGTTYYEITLKHPDKEKDMLLFSAAGPGSRELWEGECKRLSELLSLPLLEETAEGTQAPDGVTPSESVRREGALPHVSRRVRVKWVPSGVRIVHPHYWGFYRGSIIILFSVMMAAVLHMVEIQEGGKAPSVFGYAIALLIFGGLFRLFVDLASREEILLSGTGLRYRRLMFGWIRDEINTDLPALKSSSVKKDPKRPSQPPRLWIEASHRMIKFGAFLKETDLIALKDWLLFTCPTDG